MKEALPPYPIGWYAVGFSDEVGPGAVVTRQLADREVVIYRTESGAIAAVDPVCPHLGAHLGQGGTVVGESIRCPFHGFRFGTDGRCLAAYDHNVPKARARSVPSQENHGVILVYYSPTDETPRFTVPPLDMTGFLAPRRHTYRFRGHPQDTTENSVDIGHLGVVHGYERPRMTSELVVRGAELHASYEFHRPVGFLGRGLGGVVAAFDAHVYGLGYSYVETHIEKLGLEFRNFVFATPVGPMQLELRIMGTMRALGASERLSPLLAPLRLARPVARASEQLLLLRAFRIFQSDVEQDFVIWQHKAFVPRPALANGDGPVMRYRRWAEQFYEGSAVAS